MRVRSPNDIGIRVRALRKEHGISQAELARQVGVSRKWVSDLEGGKATVSLLLVMRVIGALGGELDLRPRADKGEAELAEILRAHRRT